MMSNAIMMQEAPKKDRFSNNNRCQRGSKDTLPVGPSVRYYFDPCFLDISKRDNLLGPMPEGENEPRLAPPGMPSYFAHLWAVPLLDRQQEYHCFRKLNLLKHLAADQLGGQSLLDGAVQHQIPLQRLQSLITKARNDIVESNLRLVVSIASKYAQSEQVELDELVGVGNEALIRAVDWFDFRREVRFSTYAYRAILRSMMQWLKREQRKRKVFVEDGNDASSSVARDAASGNHAATRSREMERGVRDLVTQLSERDRRIVLTRFGVDRNTGTVSFNTIAKELGVSKTRVAQLYHKSIRKLRDLALETGCGHLEDIFIFEHKR